MDEPLTVALPKGRLLAPAVELFRYLGWQPDLEGGSRQLLLTEPGPPGWPAMRFLLAKPADVPVYVEYGAADLGIAGQDVVWESGRDLYEPLQLGFGHCRLVMAGTPALRSRDLRLAVGLRVATKYPRLAQTHFQDRGLSVEVILEQMRSIGASLLNFGTGLEYIAVTSPQPLTARVGVAWSPPLARASR